MTQTPQTAAERFVELMHQAANMDEAAAVILIRDGFFPHLSEDSLDDLLVIQSFAIESGFGDQD